MNQGAFKSLQVVSDDLESKSHLHMYFLNGFSLIFKFILVDITKGQPLNPSDAMHSIFKTMTNNRTEKISMRKLLPKCVLVKFCMFKMFGDKKGLWT